MWGGDQQARGPFNNNEVIGETMITRETGIELGMVLYVKITWHDAGEGAEKIDHDVVVVGRIANAINVHTVDLKEFSPNTFKNINTVVNLLWYTNEQCHGAGIYKHGDIEYDNNYGTEIWAPGLNASINVGYVLDEMAAGVSTWELCTQREWEINNIKQKL